MRRILGAVFTGLGAFFLILAILFRFYLPGQVIKFPLNEYTVTRLTGTNASYFSQQTGTEVTGANVRAVSTTQGDVAAGSSSTAVWNNITGVFDISGGTSPGAPISYSSERFAFDRRSGELVNCCGAAVGTKRVHMSGQGYVWPIGTQKKTYQIFDTTLLKPEPARFTGTSTVNGMSVDIFAEHVSDQKVGTITLPGSLVGMSGQPEVTLPEYVTLTNTYYVDPGTGSPLKIVEAQTETLQNTSTGATALGLFHATLTTTPQSIAAAVHTAKTSDTEISWVQDIGPLIGLLLGLLLIVLGIVMLAGRDDAYEYEDEEAEVPAQA